MANSMNVTNVCLEIGWFVKIKLRKQLSFISQNSSPAIFCVPKIYKTRFMLYGIFALYSLITDAGIEHACSVIIVTKN